jgi:hypothetical protein
MEVVSGILVQIELLITESNRRLPGVQRGHARQSCTATWRQNITDLNVIGQRRVNARTLNYGLQYMRKHKFVMRFT